jgi:alkanesulfonate monooxygenase SsuD/methylene tetrahydromethanopterin reductase-like flavin-dependent oxidoreductase (luciferase family)
LGERVWPEPGHPWVAEGRRRVRFGIEGGLGPDWSANLAWVRWIEELGFDSFWVADHPLFGSVDGWTYIAALAGGTERIRLGTLVTCVCFRNPVLLARQAADVDRISNGRLVLGLGIGDFDFEFAQLGIPYPSVTQRQAMLEETVRVVRGVWRGQPFTFEGEHFRVRGAQLSTGPVQQPRVPILIAGGGERVTLRQVAQHADASNFGPSTATGDAWSANDVRRKYDVLRRHCAVLGRPYESVLRSHFNPGRSFALHEKGSAAKERVRHPTVAHDYERFIGAPAEAVAHYRGLVEAGVRYFMVSPRDAETVRLLAEKVVPQVVAG